MRQDKFDKEVKNIFGSLDEPDHKAALDRKERIWERVSPEKQPKKKSNQWWLLLLLGGLLFTAGWWLRPQKLVEVEMVVPQAAPLAKSSDDSLQLHLKRTRARLEDKDKSLDSLLEINASMNRRLIALSQKANREASEVVTSVRTIHDTIFKTDFKVVPKIVERIVRDTIIIIQPEHGDFAKPIAELAEIIPEETPEESLQSTNAKERSKVPSSVQFNFSEASLRDR